MLFMIDFLSLKKDAYGLEITDTHVRMMRLGRRHGRLFVAVAGCLALENGTVENGEIKNEADLTAALKKLAEQSAAGKKKKRYAVVSLPENKAFLQVIEMPKLDSEELRAAVVFESENHIPLPLEKVYLDFEIIPSKSLSRHRCEVAVAALPKDIVDSRVRVCDAAGWSPIAMELESQAAARSARVNCDSESPAVIIKIGDAQSSVIFCSRNSIRAVFSTPISNTYFVEKIASALGVDARRAEILKSDCGIEEFRHSADSPDSGGGEEKKIFEALVPGLVDFVQQIQKYIHYYQTHEKFGMEEKKFKKILVCGIGSNLKGLDGFLSLKLGVAVERLVLPIEADIHRLKTAGFLENGVHGYAVVAGLALRALEIETFGAENFSFKCNEKHSVPMPAPAKRALGKKIKK
jgi:type IV pilus assembly protein PilM